MSFVPLGLESYLILEKIDLSMYIYSNNVNHSVLNSDNLLEVVIFKIMLFNIHFIRLY